MVVVPLYDTLGTEAITYIVNKGTLWSAGEQTLASLLDSGIYTGLYLI